LDVAEHVDDEDRVTDDDRVAGNRAKGAGRVQREAPGDTELADCGRIDR
jgi:hypothetical protein